MIRRECYKVIDEMLTLIPESNIKLINKLKWNREDATYKPLKETIQWERTYDTLMEYLLPLDEDWKWQVMSVFTTKSIEELKKI